MTVAGAAPAVAERLRLGVGALALARSEDLR
jgi:hypothetical protein